MRAKFLQEALKERERAYRWDTVTKFQVPYRSWVDPGDRAVCGIGLLLLACWDCGFESRQRLGCLSLVNVVCCQVEVSETGRSLVQRIPTQCGVLTVCDF
jgi:hypothetical protein